MCAALTVQLSYTHPATYEARFSLLRVNSPIILRHSVHASSRSSYMISLQYSDSETRFMAPVAKLSHGTQPGCTGF